MKALHNLGPTLTAQNIKEIKYLQNIGYKVKFVGGLVYYWYKPGSVWYTFIPNRLDRKRGYDEAYVNITVEEHPQWIINKAEIVYE